jgi:hypothetical protein
MPCFQAASIRPSIWGDIISTMSLPMNTAFTDEDLGLTTDESNFDHYDFYYNLEALKEPPKMDDDTISNMQSQKSQKWS